MIKIFLNYLYSWCCVLNIWRNIMTFDKAYCEELDGNVTAIRIESQK